MTILFLHGWGGNADSWAPVARYFAREHQVLCPNLPCPPEAVYTLDDYAEDVWQFLQQHHVSQCVVIAHSFGARLVAILNNQHPELFSKIVITGGAGLPAKKTLWRWLKLKWRRAHGGSPEYRRLSPAGKKTFQNVVNRDLTPEIKQIAVPTLIINGDRDTATPLRMAKRWHDLVPGSRLVVYRGYGHFAYLENTARFIKDVAGWLA